MKDKIANLKKTREKFNSEIASDIQKKALSEQIVIDFAMPIQALKEPLLSNDEIIVSQGLLKEMKISDAEIDNMDVFKNVNQTTAETIQIVGEPQKCCCEVY